MPLEKLFANVHQIPNIPKVVQELIDSFNDPQSDADKISKNVQKDQVIAAKVLRLANSARYGAGRKVASIENAVVLLGNDALKTLIVTSGVVGAFKNIPGFDKKEFWRSSLMVGNIGKLVAKRTKHDAETAFTVGMLHNIGEVLIHLTYPDQCTRIRKMVEEGAKRSELEHNQFGFDYAEIGAELARRWNFPEAIQKGVRYQVAPLSIDPPDTYACITHIAGYLARCFMKGKDKEAVLNGFPNEVGSVIGLDLLKAFEDITNLLDSEDDIDALLAD